MLRCGRLHRLRGEARAAQKYAQEGMDLAIEGSFTTLQGWGRLELGWSQAMQGEMEEGIAQMKRGLAVWRAKGTELTVPEFLLAQAEWHQTAGKVDDGFGLLEQALAHVKRTGEVLWEAEVYRVRGDLLQLREGSSEAEASFRKAIEVARRQQAKFLELKATLGLSHLLQKEGRSEEARPLLSEIYGWFTEGFDTLDLQEARALLDVL
jgi:predicted ATPase